MAGDGFSVNRDALNQAADGVNGTIEAFNRRPVSAIPHESGAVGNDALAGAISGFLSGWQRGVQNLVTDATAVARTLAANAAAYDKADSSAQDGADAIFSRTGPDPGVR